MPRQVVITERIARKYFKDEDPIGKILIFTGTYDKVSCEVTGVMKEMPSNSHIHYNFSDFLCLSASIYAGILV